MVELCLRVVLALGLAVASLLDPNSLSPFIQQGATLCVAAAVLIWRLEAKQLWPANVATAYGFAEAAGVLVALVASGWVSLAGAVYCLPLFFVARKNDRLRQGLIPLAPAALYVASIGAGATMTYGLLIQFALAGGLMAATGIRLRKTQRAVEPTPLETKLDTPEFDLTSLLAAQETIAPELPVLPKLNVIERESKERATPTQTRVSVRQVQKLMDAEPSASGLAQYLKETTLAEGCVIYEAVSEHGRMVVRASAGDVPRRIRTESVEFVPTMSEVRLRSNAMNALREPGDDQNVSVVPLRTGHRFVGMVWLSARNSEQLEQVSDQVEELAPLMARWLAHQQHRQLLEKRIAELETMHLISSVSQGSETPRTLFARVIRELWGEWTLDHLGISILDAGQLLPISTMGAPNRMLDLLNHENAQGLAAWNALGANPIFIENTHESAYCDDSVAVKNRIGSGFICPIYLSGDIYAVMTGSCHRKHGIAGMENLVRSVCIELSQAVNRLTGVAIPSLVTGQEVIQRVGERGGSIAVLQIERELVAAYSTDLVSRAMRKASHLLKATLPVEANLTWKDFEIIIHFPSSTEAQAMDISQNACAKILEAGVRIGEGVDSMPLRLNARVSQVNLQAAVHTGTDASLEVSPA